MESSFPKEHLLLQERVPPLLTLADPSCSRPWIGHLIYGGYDLSSDVRCTSGMRFQRFFDMCALGNNFHRLKTIAKECYIDTSPSI